MASSLLLPLSTPSSPFTFIDNSAAKSSFFHGTTKLFPSFPKTTNKVERRWKNDGKNLKRVCFFEIKSRNMKKLGFLHLGVDLFIAFYVIDVVMDNYKSAPKHLYGLSPSQMDMFMTEDNPIRQQSERVTEESISSAKNYLDQGGMWSHSSMGNNGPAKYSMSVSMYRGGGRGAGRPRTAPPDLPSLLLDARICYLGMPIVPAVAELLVAQFMWLDYDNPKKPIYLYINSSGTQNEKNETVGSETEAYSIADMISYVKSDVYTVNCGMAYGQAAMLLSLGTKGYRALQPNSSTPTIFLYNTLISSLTHNNQIHLALSLYNRILNNHTLQPNTFTFPSLFKACASHPSYLHYGPPLHTHLFKFIEQPFDHFIQSSLLNFYAKYGKLNVSASLFSQITQPDLATWNTMLAAYANSADSDMSLEALHLFNHMRLGSQIRPNEVTLVALITACSNLSALPQGAWLHCYVLRNNLKLNRFVGTALVDMYSKCACLKLAYQLFDELSERDTFCYNAMIGGFAINGHGHEALKLYRNMKLEGLLPDAATFVVTMFACSHVGLVEDGLQIFKSIKEVHGMEPTLDHYGCLIDLLCRAGRLKEAEEKLAEMPMKPNAVSWRSLLGAARLHRNINIGEVALKHLIELEPETSGNYVLLSNMYASIGRWNDVKRVRMMMKDHGVKKLPGSSLVEINGTMHEFLTCDKTHPCSEEIYLKIVEINRRLRDYGYKARTSDVLLDVEEEDKEGVLSYHSERLAIAFALIASASTLPIRIIKNLRVCGDCHDITKLISAAYQRDIIVRDRNRFHHFHDGTCSCLDYW
ncbi:unnamed protein product [Lupinus luteus]|uniref:DYW domain-containing protein n=1 Tax=Lupinus luteus TaxID=3873 RepID=A0AAV1X3Z3_LUPLU